ncbi:HDOD domain-containing protein [Thalassotalea atypica]|uniref:HDOD domain-containing protein n=1 Tax=Thalassotalea atypica TaxID=2054316 RepID=UPI002572FDE4|nr:HDOD domain-containing protein [Thalassotalea atypica]
MTSSALQYAQNAQELCVLPDIYLKLKQMLEDQQASLDDIASVITLDPALASKLLQIANSAMFNFPREIDDIGRALRVLGLKEVHSLLDAYGVTAAFSGLDPDVLDMERFWEISVDCALIAKFIAAAVSVKHSQSLFLSGLFHNIGELAIVHSEREKVKYCETIERGETPWQRQQDVFGFTFADCSTELLKLWQLPDSIIIPIKEHNQGYAGELDKLSAIIYVASRLAVCNSHPGLYPKIRLIGQHVLDDLGINEQTLNDAINYCNSEGMTIMSILKV